MQGDHSCGLVVRVPNYRSRGSGSIPVATNPQKLALTLLASGGHSGGIVRSRTQATELLNPFLKHNARKEHRMRACGSIVAEALCYKPEGRGFDFR
jgi:hypothetical protein